MQETYINARRSLCNWIRRRENFIQYAYISCYEQILLASVKHSSHTYYAYPWEILDCSLL